MKVNKDKETIRQYLSDESAAFSAKPDNVEAVYFPETEDELVEIIRTFKGKITISGAGTGITGSRVPIHGGIVISTERMIKPGKRVQCRELSHKGLAGDFFIYLDEEKHLAHAGPGTSISELACVLPRNMIYPPDPTETSALLGGTVATNASGARCFYYGPTRNWVVGLRLVLSDGEVVDVRRGRTFADENGIINFTSETGKHYRIRIPEYHMPDVKNAAGLYSKPGMDLIDLFIGSEGILGIISEISIKLIRVDKEPVSILAFFRSENDAMGYVDIIRDMKDRGILAIEYFDRNALDFIRAQFPEIKPDLDAAILLEMKAESLDTLAEISELLSRFNEVEDWCATTSSDLRDLKEFRHSLPDSVNAYLKRHESYKIGTDFVVPVRQFPRMMTKYKEVGEKFKHRFPRTGTHYVIFGHIGDCHLHFNFITASDGERVYAKELYLELARTAIALGGTISGEHGVGKKTLLVEGRNIPYLELMYGESGIREIARVKRELDPELRLNVGNMGVV
ncbi:MAG: FAD-binding oxidoreductase [Thermoplasmata archaeon]|nr:FAD-binding oxidoreductase [Thermoplasmata archaeon]